MLAPGAEPHYGTIDTARQEGRKGYGMKGMIKTIVTLAIIGAALYFTNPDMEDFGEYYQRQQITESQKGVTGVLKDIVKALAQSGADLVVKVGFKRDDQLLFSFFTLGPKANPSSRYIGFGKFIFIELE